VQQSVPEGQLIELLHNKSLQHIHCESSALLIFCFVSRLLTDFTVYDYAHSDKNISATTQQHKTRSTVSSGRLQKAATNAWQTEGFVTYLLACFINLLTY